MQLFTIGYKGQVSMLTRLVEPFTELVRWGEPWDVEDDDPLFDGGSLDAPFSRWG